MGPTLFPETSVNNYHTTPCNYPKDHRLHDVICLQIQLDPVVPTHVNLLHGERQTVLKKKLSAIKTIYVITSIYLPTAIHNHNGSKKML
jgi:hypothetical protein